MKQILIIVGIILPLFLFGGCQTEQKTEAQNEFEHDLMGLYADVQAITNQAQTRSLDEEWIPPTEAELELIFAEIARIAEENGIAEQVLASGYYQNIEALNFAEMDIYEVLQWVEKNGTAEVYNMLLEMSNGTLTAESIFNNTGLLPNEKLGLTVSIGMLENLPNLSIYMVGDNIDNCLATYRGDFKVCDIIYGLSRFMQVTLAYVTKGLSIFAEQLLDWSVGGAYEKCLNDADNAFLKCIQ